MKYWLRSVVGVLALVAVCWVFRENIGYFLFKQSIEKQIGWDLRDDLDSGLHVAFCGTGSPLPDRGRGGACTAVIAGDRVFLFDSGEGSAKSLALMGILPSSVEAVFLTHFHSDHINGLGALVLQHVFRGGVSTPLSVYGGPGVERVVNGFNEAFALDHIYRVTHIGEDAAPPSGFKLKAKHLQVKEGEVTSVLQVDGVSISAFNVDHHPIEPAYGYRIEYGGRSVVISGDTSYSKNLVFAATGADLLIHEALAPKLVATIEETATRHGREGLAMVMSHIPNYHASPQDAVRTANEAGVSALALTHLIPGLPGIWFDRLFTAGAENAFDGQFWMLQDGDVISLPEVGGMRRFRAN